LYPARAVANLPQKNALARGGDNVVAATAKLAPRRNRWVRILGVAFVMYVLSYIDRTNIAMAIPAMRTELGISASAIGFATGMFFWGYIILQIPAGRLASVWSAKWVILGLLLFWSVVSFSTAFVRTENQLIANRFILGLFEGGVLTCTIVLIRKWFTRAERARANTMFLISIPIASVIANPISGLVLAHFDWQTVHRRGAPGWCGRWCGSGRSRRSRAMPSGSIPTRKPGWWRRSQPRRPRPRPCRATGSGPSGIPPCSCWRSTTSPP
jgi:MFS family permease